MILRAEVLAELATRKAVLFEVHSQDVFATSTEDKFPYQKDASGMLANIPNGTNNVTGFYREVLWSNPAFPRFIDTALDQDLCVYVVAGDMNGLKQVNDQESHDAGNAALREFFQKGLKQAMENCAAVRSFAAFQPHGSGDEFNMVIVAYPDFNEKDILSALKVAVPFIPEGKKQQDPIMLRASASIGQYSPELHTEKTLGDQLSGLAKQLEVQLGKIKANEKRSYYLERVSELAQKHRQNLELFDAACNELLGSLRRMSEVELLIQDIKLGWQQEVHAWELAALRQQIASSS